MKSYKDAKAFVRKLKLKNNLAWSKYCASGKKPIDIPALPERSYSDEWESYSEWLGNQNISNNKKGFLEYKKAKEFVHQLRLNSSNEWRKYCNSGKRPDNIPYSPDKAYLNKGWVSWYAWLGTKK